MRDAALRRAEGAAELLSLIEVAGPDGRPPQPGPVAAIVDEALSAALRPDSVAGALAPGRYGVVSRSGTEADLAGLGAQIRDAMRGAGLEATVGTRSVPLRADGLTPVQRTRALRYALDAFSRGGHRAVTEAGFAEDGLPGFVSRACSRAETLRRAIADRRFSLAFQPIVSMGDRAVEHYEALLRPDAELAIGVRPRRASSSRLAEMMGMSEELDWAVVEAASAAVAAEPRPSAHRRQPVRPLLAEPRLPRAPARPSGPGADAQHPPHGRDHRNGGDRGRGGGGADRRRRCASAA